MLRQLQQLRPRAARPAHVPCGHSVRLHRRTKPSNNVSRHRLLSATATDAAWSATAHSPHVRVQSLQKRLADLEAERDDVFNVARVCAQRSRRLLARVQSLSAYAAEKSAAGDVQSASSTLKTKASVRETLEKNIDRAQINYALASKLTIFIGTLQTELSLLMAADSHPAVASPFSSSCPPASTSTAYSSATTYSTAGPTDDSAAATPPVSSQPSLRGWTSRTMSSMDDASDREWQGVPSASPPHIEVSDGTQPVSGADSSAAMINQSASTSQPAAVGQPAMGGKSVENPVIQEQSVGWTLGVASASITDGSQQKQQQQQVLLPEQAAAAHAPAMAVPDDEIKELGMQQQRLSGDEPPDTTAQPSAVGELYMDGNVQTAGNEHGAGDVSHTDSDTSDDVHGHGALYGRKGLVNFVSGIDTDGQVVQRATHVQ